MAKSAKALEVKQGHMWVFPWLETYFVRVIARDSYGAVGDWSYPLIVTVPTVLSSWESVAGEIQSWTGENTHFALPDGTTIYINLIRNNQS